MITGAQVAEVLKEAHPFDEPDEELTVRIAGFINDEQLEADYGPAVDSERMKWFIIHLFGFLDWNEGR